MVAFDPREQLRPQCLDAVTTDTAEHVITFEVEQDHLEQGVVTLPRQWRSGAALAREPDA